MVTIFKMAIKTNKKFYREKETEVSGNQSSENEAKWKRYWLLDCCLTIGWNASD